jgi:hypothetical protein
MESKKYVVLSKLSKTKFKRYTGVSKDVFEVMVKLVSQHEQKRKKKEGRTAHLSIEDQILMTLEYYREYRTLFHIGTDYGLDESNVQRTVVKIESILIESGHFNLPGKKVLLSADKIQTILTDATETPTARPKKKSARVERSRALPSANVDTRAKRSDLSTKLK